MALYGVRLVINLFDLCIYRRYLEEFIGNRKTSMEFSVLLLIVCELIGSAVNQMGISWLNFVTMVVILCVYVCQYEAGIVSRLIAVLLYMGIMGISEPAGYLFSKVFMEQIEYYGAAEPPVRCGESHLSGLTEPPQFVY